MRSNLGIVASGAGVAAAAFHPITSIAWDHAYWAEGTEFVALGYTNGGSITTIPDEIGTADLTNATVAQRPLYRSAYTNLNSQPAMDADPADASWDFMSYNIADIAQPYTVALVVEGIGSGQLPVGEGTGWAFYNNAGTWKAYAGTTLAGGTSDTGKHLMLFEGNGASSKIIVDGTTVVTGNAGTSAWTKFELFGVAGTLNLQGAIAFAAIKGAILSADDKASLRTWSQGKYGTG
jgi:hypothetical protein